MNTNIWKILLALFAAVELATVVKWFTDGRNILTKQQMAVEKVVRDEVFGTTITKTEFVSGFWLGLDIAAPIFVACAIGFAFCIWRLKRS